MMGFEPLRIALSAQSGAVHFGAGELFADLGRDIFGVLLGVAMAQKNGFGIFQLSGFTHMLDKGVKGLAAAAHLFDRDQMTLVVNVKNRLDAEHGADKGRRAADASAALQMVEVIDGEPVCEVVAVVNHPLLELLHGKARALLLHGIVHQKALAHGSGKRVHHDDGAFRESGAQLFDRHTGAVVRAGEAG